MPNSQITAQDNSQGLVDQIISVEEEAEKLIVQVKELQLKSKSLRQKLLEDMNVMQLKTLKHQSGMRVTVTNTQKLKVLDEQMLIDDLNEKKLVNFILEVPKQIIPEHKEVNLTLLKGYLKTSAWKPEDFNGIEIINDQHITIAKGK